MHHSQGERTCRQSMKAALRISNARAVRGGSRKLDRGFHAFAAAAAEIYLLQVAACQLAQAVRQFTGDLRHVALQHRRSTFVHLLL
jgi:hypothetical protein